MQRSIAAAYSNSNNNNISRLKVIINDTYSTAVIYLISTLNDRSINLPMHIYEK